MFGNSLAEEYRLLEERLGFSRPELRSLILNAISASWLPLKERPPCRPNFVPTRPGRKTKGECICVSKT